MNNFTYPYERDFECILVDKVFDSCLKKVCFDDIRVNLPSGIDPETCDIDVKFHNGVVENLEVLKSSMISEDCRRVKMTVRASITVILRCGGKCFEIPSQLPKIPLDIVLYHPDTRPEFKFDIIVETRGKVLDSTIECDCNSDNDRCALTLAIGIFIVPKVIGRVQLKVGKMEEPYCTPFRECRDFSEISACDNFDTEPFPGDFYPPQADEIYPCDL
ncbi:MAG: hypothetical protein AB7G87_13370 [Clostridia bacterium]